MNKLITRFTVIENLITKIILQCLHVLYLKYDEPIFI